MSSKDRSTISRREALTRVGALALVACGGRSSSSDGPPADVRGSDPTDGANVQDAAAPDGPDAPAPPPGTTVVDVVVSSASALRNTLLGWQADWNGTVPPGKTPSDERVVGLDTTVVGPIDLSGIQLPQRVCVRAVGTFLADYSCSTYVQGTISLAGSRNLWLCLMDVRAPNSSGFATGLVNLDGTTGCGLLRCSVSGWPFVVAPGATGTTSYAISPNGATDLTMMHNVYRYMKDGFAKWRGTIDNLRLEGNMGLYCGGDDHTVASGAALNDPLIIANYFDRHHAKAVGVHNDGWQQNSGGSQLNRYVLRYNVGYRGTWTGTGETTENGWQLWYLSGAGGPSTGPWLAEHCLFLNGQQRAIDRIPGAGTSTVRYCAAIDSAVDASQVANARFPRIIGADLRERNFVTAPHAAYTNGEGTNGIKVILGSTPDHAPLLAYMETIPTDATDLWDIRPKAGTRYHPAYAPAADRVGPFELWEKLLAGDPQVVLSKVGWPVAPLFIADFDRGDHFWGGYSGTFDANGDNT